MKSRFSLHHFFSQLWYSPLTFWRTLALLLRPLSWIFQGLSFLRRHSQKQHHSTFSVPVVIVGNLTVGGTGKTPVVIELVNCLKQRGIQVGVISRGYGRASSSRQQSPILLDAGSKPYDCGDEPCLIAYQSACPVCVGPDRRHAAEYLLKMHPDLQMIISDDGLQHYRLARSFEIVVVDAARGIGNGACLPAGPLREPVERLSTVDWILLNGDDEKALSFKKLSTQYSKHSSCFELQPQAWFHVPTGKRLSIDTVPWQTHRALVAVAGIGNPQRFTDTLHGLGIYCTLHSFPDHHIFTETDFADFNDEIVLMTMKDAIKCKAFARDTWWALDVKPILPNLLLEALETLL